MNKEDIELIDEPVRIGASESGKSAYQIGTFIGPENAPIVGMPAIVVVEGKNPPDMEAIDYAQVTHPVAVINQSHEEWRFVKRKV